MVWIKVAERKQQKVDEIPGNVAEKAKIMRVRRIKATKLS